MIKNIKYVTQIINGAVSTSGQEESIPYATDNELASILIDLIQKGYAFTDEPAGWSPAAIVENLRDKGFIQQGFKSISWKGPNDYRVYEVK